MTDSSLGCGSVGKVSPADAPCDSGPRLRGMLLVVPTFYPDFFGGAERQAKILSAALQRQGVQVTILTPTVNSITAEEAADFGRIVRFRVRHYPNLGGVRFASTLRWTSEVAQWAMKHRLEFDVVYVFHARLHALAGLAAARLTAKPLMIKLGGSGEGFDFTILRGKRGGYGRIIAALLSRLTDGFVANSAQIEQELVQIGIDRTRIFAFHNGVVMPRRATVQSALASRTGQRFIFVGRLDAEKRVELLVDAVAHCRDAGTFVELSFAGDGPARADLEARVRASGLADRVRFLGRIDDVYPQLLGHDFFISASLREGQSNALLEAMATGCIPIVANVSGASDVVVDGVWGFLVESSVRGLAGAMLRARSLGAEARQTISLAAYDYVQASLDIDLIARLTIETAELIMSRRRTLKPRSLAGTVNAFSRRSEEPMKE